MHGLFLHCRIGFESECAAEIQAQAANLGITGYCKAKTSAAYVVFVTQQAEDAARLIEEVPFTQLIFTRQWFSVVALLKELDSSDRIAGLVPALAAAPPAAELFLETTDTNEGKELQALCRKLARPLEAALQRAGRLDDNARGQRLHICFLATTAAYAGIAPVANSSSVPMGIPRLRFPGGAPSRSTLKLEEALLSFLTPGQRALQLQPGMQAVDLGAAPGGWTWQLVNRGLQVIAVDNGAIDQGLMDSGRVEHRREDGFHFRPEQPVDWMVCDIVEQPIRIAELAARWLSAGWCRYSIFNLKLPMKKRYLEVERCLALVRERLDEVGRRYRLGCKQLYHDREEVTVFVEIVPGAVPQSRPDKLK